LAKDCLLTSLLLFPLSSLNHRVTRPPFLRILRPDKPRVLHSLCEGNPEISSSRTETVKTTADNNSSRGCRESASRFRNPGEQSRGAIRGSSRREDSSRGFRIKVFRVLVIQGVWPLGPIVRSLGKQKCARVSLKEIAPKSSVVMHILKKN